MNANPKPAATKLPLLEQEKRPSVPIAQAGCYLNLTPQTWREWACYSKHPRNIAPRAYWLQLGPASCWHSPDAGGGAMKQVVCPHPEGAGVISYDAKAQTLYIANESTGTGAHASIGLRELAAHLLALGGNKNSVGANTCKPFTPRQERVIHALLHTTGWIARESIDRIAGASNGPEVIRQLRQRFGYGCIEMERINVIDRDGFPAQPGRYRITDEGRESLAEKGVQ